LKKNALDLATVIISFRKRKQIIILVSGFRNLGTGLPATANTQTIGPTHPRSPGSYMKQVYNSPSVAI